jgi:hypothetical protein
MTIRLSTMARNKLLDGGAAGGIKGAFNLGFMNIYAGSQPSLADNAATGTLLGTVSVNAGGVGLTFASAVDGVISKTVAELWRFTGLADGIAGWFRLYEATDTPGGALGTTKARIDGAIGSSGADLNLTNLQVKTGVVNTCDTFTITMPAV